MSIRRTEDGFEAEDGLRLFRRAWLPADPDFVLLLVHGFAEHSGRYDHVGAWFASRGAAVHAYDHRGHGRSAGPRNDVPRFDCFLDDLGSFLEIVRKEHPGLRVAVVGHSMGGLIATAFARERQPSIEALVTSGPALHLGPAMQGARAGLLRVMARLTPTLRIPAGLPASGLSGDPEVIRRYEEDPLVDTRLTPRLAREMQLAIERTAGGGAAVSVPMLLLHGAADPLCASAGSEAFFASLAPSVAEQSALRLYPELLHEIFNEPEQEQVFHDLLSWWSGLEGAAGEAP